MDETTRRLVEELIARHNHREKEVSAGEDATQAAKELADGLIDMTTIMSPIFDTADGMRADLERRGWSSTAAETVAMDWLRISVSKVWGSAGGRH